MAASAAFGKPGTLRESTVARRPLPPDRNTEPTALSYCRGGCDVAESGSGGFYADHLPDGTTIGPEGDVNVFVLPGHDRDDPPLLVSGQFAAAFTSKPGVDALLAYLATAESGEPWAKRGGYLSPHLEFALDVSDDDFEVRLAAILSQATVVRFDAADTMPPEVGLGTFWDGVVEFVATRNLDAAVATINSGYEQIDPLLLADLDS